MVNMIPNSADIYKNGCYVFGWDISQLYKFGAKYRKLLATRADTDRTRDVWFIAHSNLNDSKNEYGTYEYFIDKEYITETYRDKFKMRRVYQDRRDRIVMVIISS
jgi:hypothetical protein